MERAADRVATNQNQTFTFLVLLALTLSSSFLAAQTAKPAASHSVGRTAVVSIPDRKLAVIENGKRFRHVLSRSWCAGNPQPYWSVPDREPRFQSQLLPARRGHP